MGKTYRRNQSYKPKGGKDFGKFKKSNKWKKWNEKPHHNKIVDVNQNLEDSNEI